RRPCKGGLRAGTAAGRGERGTLRRRPCIPVGTTALKGDGGGGGHPPPDRAEALRLREGFDRAATRREGGRTRPRTRHRATAACRGRRASRAGRHGGRPAAA